MVNMEKPKKWRFCPHLHQLIPVFTIPWDRPTAVASRLWVATVTDRSSRTAALNRSRRCCIRAAPRGNDGVSGGEWRGMAGEWLIMLVDDMNWNPVDYWVDMNWLMLNGDDSSWLMKAVQCLLMNDDWLILQTMTKATDIWWTVWFKHHLITITIMF